MPALAPREENKLEYKNLSCGIMNNKQAFMFAAKQLVQ